MPVGYLFTVGFLAWCTLLALAPLRGSWHMGRISWRFAFLLNELPFVAAYFLLASTALAFGQGDIDSAGGWATVGLAALTVVGLGVVVRRGLQAGPVLERALAEGLGSASRRRRLPWAQILLAPFAVRRRDVEHVRDIAYSDEGRRHLLDVYRHRSRPA